MTSGYIYQQELGLNLFFDIYVDSKVIILYINDS